MIRNTSSPVPFRFKRSGGSIVIARIDVWEPTPSEWKSVGQFHFKDSTKSTESTSGALPKGSYTCVFQCYVEESLNGKYGFSLDVGGKRTFEDDGDVNTTSAPDDHKVFKDQFVLHVQ